MDERELKNIFNKDVKIIAIVEDMYLLKIDNVTKYYSQKEILNLKG